MFPEWPQHWVCGRQVKPIDPFLAPNTVYIYASEFQCIKCHAELLGGGASAHFHLC